MSASKATSTEAWGTMKLSPYRGVATPWYGTAALAPWLARFRLARIYDRASSSGDPVTNRAAPAERAAMEQWIHPEHPCRVVPSPEEDAEKQSERVEEFDRGASRAPGVQENITPAARGAPVRLLDAPRGPASRRRG